MSGPDLTPPPDRDLPAIEQRRGALVRELRAPRPSWRRRRNVVLVPAGLLVTAGAAWAAGVFGGPVKDVSAVVCRADTQRAARTVTLPSDISGHLPDSATEACAAVPEVAKGLGYVRAGGGIRPLVSCRGERQAVVVPGRDAHAACGRLGLDPLPAVTFRAEVRRQVAAHRLVAPLFPDPDASQQGRVIGPDEGPDCILAGALRRRARQVLRDHGFADFHVDLVKGARPSDCTADLSLATDSDGRTIQIDTDATDDAARELARHTLADAACRRLAREGRLRRPGDIAVLEALECVDAELTVRRGRGLLPAETPGAVRDRLGLAGWRTVVKVPPGRGVAQFGSTSVDRRRRTIEVGFELRRIVTPGARSRARAER